MFTKLAPSARSRRRNRVDKQTKQKKHPQQNENKTVNHQWTTSLIAHIRPRPGLGFEVHWIFGCNNVEVFCCCFLFCCSICASIRALLIPASLTIAHLVLLFVLFWHINTEYALFSFELGYCFDGSVCVIPVCVFFNVFVNYSVFNLNEKLRIVTHCKSLQWLPLFACFGSKNVVDLFKSKHLRPR